MERVSVEKFLLLRQYDTTLYRNKRTAEQVRELILLPLKPTATIQQKAGILFVRPAACMMRHNRATLPT
jgi:hypothetical protein